MADFNWEELPAQVEIDKAPKRDTQTAVGSGKFHYQPLPHRDLADDFMKFIRAAGDHTEPASTILAKLVTEYKDAEGKTKKVTKGVMVRYSAGLRRGRKSEEENGETAEENGETAEANGENGAGSDDK
jgi:hypothetical protein